MFSLICFALSVSAGSAHCDQTAAGSLWGFYETTGASGNLMCRLCVLSHVADLIDISVSMQEKSAKIFSGPGTAEEGPGGVRPSDGEAMKSGAPAGSVIGAPEDAAPHTHLGTHWPRRRSPLLLWRRGLGSTAAELRKFPRKTRRLLPLLPPREERAGERRAVPTPMKPLSPAPLPLN